jgi:hypothetical protein
VDNENRVAGKFKNPPKIKNEMFQEKFCNTQRIFFHKLLAVLACKQSRFVFGVHPANVNESF